jgi:membrane-associated protein
VGAGGFVAIVRALTPAAAGAAGVRYRSFTLYNVLGGVIWGVGYSLLGYLAGSAYAVAARRVGTGLAVVIAIVVAGAITLWLVRRHRAAARPGQAAGPAAERPASTTPD